MSGLRVEVAGAAVCVDPPARVADPVILTWSEQERVAGAAGVVAAHPDVLAWLGIPGTPLGDPVEFGGFTVRSRPYTPIPYATALEALRKTRSALVAPRLAWDRLSFTLRRPRTPPLALTLDRAGERVVVLGQALHRFLDPDGLDDLARWAGHASLVVAGTDYDDEVATGTMLGAFDAESRVLADLTGPIRRVLGLPVRPLEVALAAAPPGTTAL